MKLQMDIIDLIELRDSIHLKTDDKVRDKLS